MKYRFSIAVAVSMASPAIAADDTPWSVPLRVLYVGNTNTDRGRSYARFLGEKFVLVDAADRRSFDPGALPVVDVVVLDWSQSDTQRDTRSARTRSAPESDLKSPLGQRSRWTKPTVLLGSAGHLLAAPWKVFGGSG